MESYGRVRTGAPEIWGFVRPDGRLGIRNRVAIIYTTHCSSMVAGKLQRLFPASTQVFGDAVGCRMREGAFHKIAELGKHSQYGAALVVGLGCEGTEAMMVAEEIAKSGKPVEAIKIQDEGGDLKTLEKGSRLLMRLIQHTSQAERAKLTPSDLIVGAECGGSDATSGLASNPIVGAAADLLIESGGTYMHEELPELLTCEEILAARAVNEKVAQEIREAILEAERKCFEGGRFNWVYGNILGGLTSIEEKSLGALAKAGSKPLQGLLREYGLPPGKGYWVQIGEPESRMIYADPEGINQFAAHGAHLALFTTGCGSTTGGLIPVIKILANPKRRQLLEDNADLDGTPVILGERTIEDLGAVLYQEILAVAAGKLTKSEMLEHFEA